MVDCCIPCINPSDSVDCSRQEKLTVDCCILILFITMLPLNLSTINMMLGEGLLGSSESVLTLISVCFVDREEIPFTPQKHACCWVVNTHQITHADMTYSAPNCCQCASKCHCKRRWRSKASHKLLSPTPCGPSSERKIDTNLSTPVDGVAVSRRRLRNLTPRRARAMVWCLSLMVGVGGVGSWTILWAAIGFRQWIGGGEADFWREKKLSICFIFNFANFSNFFISENIARDGFRIKNKTKSQES